MLPIFMLFTACEPSQKIKFRVDGAERSFHLTKPKGIKDNQTYPLIITLHGNPSSAWQMKTYTGMAKAARKQGFFSVFPNAKKFKYWPINEAGLIMEEMEFLEELILYMKRNYPIDQVFLCGMSAGGITTYHFALTCGDLLAGAAVISGNLSYFAAEMIRQADHELPPLLLIHGTDDFIFHGTEDELISNSNSVKNWKGAIHCHSDSKINPMANRHQRDDSKVQKIVFNCPTPFIYYRVEGGGHHWPGSRFNANHFTSLKLSNRNKDIDANELILNFFLAQAP